MSIVADSDYPLEYSADSALLSSAVLAPTATAPGQLAFPAGLLMWGVKTWIRRLHQACRAPSRPANAAPDMVTTNLQLDKTLHHLYKTLPEDDATLRKLKAFVDGYGPGQ